MGPYFTPGFTGGGYLARINIIFVLLFVLLFPYNSRYITYLIGPWAIISIILMINNRTNIMEIIGSGFLSLIFFSIALLSLAYSNDVNNGIKILETQTAIIVTPFLMTALKSRKDTENKELIINAYLMGLLLYIVISITIFFVNSDMRNVFNYLKNNTITDTAEYFKLSYFQYRSYISMYMILGIVLILNRSFRNKNYSLSYWKIFLSLLFLLYIIMLGSRSGLLTLLIVGIYYFLRLIKNFSLWVSLTSSLFIIILLTTSLLKFTRIGDTVNILRKGDNSSTDIRIHLWSDALKVFKSAPFFGHGIGDGEAQMIVRHKENKFIDSIHAYSNAHNQYLETATQTGIIGLLSLILMLSVPFFKSIRKKQELLFLFLIIIGINFLFESMLMKLSGVLFFSFWLNYLLQVHYNQSDRE